MTSLKTKYLVKLDQFVIKTKYLVKLDQIVRDYENNQVTGEDFWYSVQCLAMEARGKQPQ